MGGPLDALNALVAVLTLGLGVVTFFHSRRDRREDLRLRAEEEQKLADVDRNTREEVTHAATLQEARLALEDAQQRRRLVEAAYSGRDLGRPLFEGRMLLAACLAAWGIILAVSNREGQASADPANVGWGVGVGVIAVMLGWRGFQEARRGAAHAAEAIWVVVLVLGASAVVVCLVALSAYRPA